MHKTHLFIVIINGIKNNSTQLKQDQAKESCVVDFEEARKINEKKLHVCQGAEDTPDNRILASLELPRGQAILIWLNFII